MNCKNFQNKTIAVMMIVVMALAAVPAFLADGSDAASSFEVTDGKGNTVSFDSVPEHIITIGKGVTATAIEVGALDKIVVCDSYSYKATEDVYAALKTKVDAGDIKANGNVYSSGKSNLLTDIVDSADTVKGGVFDKTSDVILITGSDTYIVSIIDTLKEYGFTKILAWNDITNYSDIIGFIETVSKVTKGSVDPAVEQMKNLSKVITDKLEGKEKAKAFYVTYSGGTFKVGNTGSLANSMILAAGGDSVTVNSEVTTSTYAANLTDIVEKNPKVIIFVDNTIVKNDSYMSDLKTQVGSGVTLVPLNSLWNNYCVESMNGVWTMACAMYPDVFSGDIPTVDNSTSDDLLLYIGVAVVAVIVIGIVGFMFLRKH